MSVELSHPCIVERGVGGRILTLFNLFQLLAGEVSRFHGFKQNLVAKFRLLQVRASVFIDLPRVGRNWYFAKSSRFSTLLVARSVETW